MKIEICTICGKPANRRLAIVGFQITGWILDGDEFWPTHGGVAHPSCLIDAPPDAPYPEESVETYRAYDKGDRDYDLSINA